MCNQPCTQALTLCSEWPYDINFTKIKDWKAIYNQDEMKKVLSEHGCLVADMLVYQDFINYPNGIYQHATGVYRGNHAVTIVGYDDVDDCWICKNSWGTGWGEAGGGQAGGWFRIAYNECGIDDTMYKIELFCPAEESATAMGFSKDTIKMIRDFRDGLLTTRKGRAYLDLALENIGNVTRVFHLLKKNDKINMEAAKALKPFIEAVKTMNTRRPLRLEEKHFNAAVIVLDKLAEVDRNLRPAVKRIKEETPRYVGKNLREIMRELF